MSDTRPYIRSEQRQAETVEAVIKLCADHNPATLTTAAIAKQVNLTQGALFKHFPNKDSLWEAVARWLARQLVETISAVADRYPSPLQALEAMFLAHVEFVSHHPGTPRLILGELQKPEQNRAKAIIRQALANYRAHIRKLLTTGMAHGEIRPDLDADAAAVLYLGAIQGLVLQAMVGGDITAAIDAAPKVFALYRQGIEEQG